MGGAKVCRELSICSERSFCTARSCESRCTSCRRRERGLWLKDPEVPGKWKQIGQDLRLAPKPDRFIFSHSCSVTFEVVQRTKVPGFWGKVDEQPSQLAMSQLFGDPGQKWEPVLGLEGHF